jgi:hypothetical protein
MRGITDEVAVTVVADVRGVVWVDVETWVDGEPIERMLETIIPGTLSTPPLERKFELRRKILFQ